MTAPDYLRPADVAQRLGVDAITVRRWIQRGDLAAYRIGREWRIDPSDVDAFMLERRTGPDRQLPNRLTDPITRAGGRR